MGRFYQLQDAQGQPALKTGARLATGQVYGIIESMRLRYEIRSEREGIVEHVRETEDELRSTLEQLLDLPIVGDVRGAGYLFALELVKDKETRETFSDEESETLLRGFLSGRLFERGLICRADDRGDPVVQISPPLVAGKQEFDEIVGILGDVLAEAWERMG